jgi:simple sugar transport system ATP-binding protein
VLRLDGVRAGGVSPVSLTVGSEIFGVAGVDGNGQQELAELVVGLRRAAAGAIYLNGVEITGLSVAGRAGLGLAHVPNDRKAEGLVGSMSVGENVALKHHRGRRFRGGA